MTLALAYLLCVAASMAALAVVLRRRPAPTPPQAPAPAPALPATSDAHVRVILSAAAQLAQLTTQQRAA